MKRVLILIFIFTLYFPHTFSQGWKKIADFTPGKHYSAASFSVGEYGYVATGILEGYYTRVLYRYDPENNKWELKNTFPGTSREGAVGFSIGNYGYVGLGSQLKTFFKDFYKYDPVKNSWSKIADFPGGARTDATAFVIGTKAYVVGGLDSSKYFNDCWEYDPDSNSWTRKADIGGDPLSCLSSFTLNNKGYILGGSDDVAYSQYFQQYDPIKNIWNDLNNSPFTCDKMSAFVIYNRAFAGLGSENTQHNDFYEYDLISDKWTPIADFPGEGRGYAAAFTVGNYGYVGIGQSNNEYKDFYRLDLITPNVCMVTSDQITGKNLIVWEKEKTDFIKKYTVYKEDFQSGNYLKIGSVDYDEISVFTDDNSDPRTMAYRYKLTATDTFGAESSFGKEHKTIHLTANLGTGNTINLIWSHYEGFPFTNYKIYRGTSPAKMTLLTQIQSTLNSFTDMNPPAGAVYYQISASKIDTCFPLIYRGTVNPGPFSQSSSNIKDYNINSTNYLDAFPRTLNPSVSKNQLALFVYSNLKTWTATSSHNWAKLSIDKINNQILVDIDSNTTGQSRTALIRIYLDGVTTILVPVIQEGVTSVVTYIKNELKIFPVPATNTLFIDSPKLNSAPYSVSISDISGKRFILFENQTDELLAINIENLPKGMYIVLYSGEKSYVGKFIKN